MAQLIEKDAKVWTKDVATVAVEADTIEYDITTKLKEVMALYIAKAVKLEKLAIGDVKEGMLAGAAYYHRCASAVAALYEVK